MRLEYLIEMFNQLDPQLQDVALEHLKKLLKLNNENTIIKR